jgi:hypothetical protein
MTTTPSFLDLLRRLECGDPEAAAILFHAYAHRLIGLARRRLDERVRAKVDADDVVNSVIRTFCRRAAERPFDLDGPDDLWALLVEIALRKCGRWNRRIAPATLALFGMAALLATIVIRIRGKGGLETTIEVPDGSKVMIGQEGQVVVVPPDAAAAHAVPPLAEGGEPLGPFALVRRPARLKVVRSWTIETRHLRGGTISLAMRPDGRQLAVSSFDGVIRLYDPSTGRLQKALYGQQKWFADRVSLSWSPDGKSLVSSDE